MCARVSVALAAAASSQQSSGTPPDGSTCASSCSRTTIPTVHLGRMALAKGLRDQNAVFVCQRFGFLQLNDCAVHLVLNVQGKREGRA